MTRTQRLVRGRSARGFTVVELLVVVGLIAMVLGLLMPALKSVRTAARKTLELNAARQLMIAYSLYADQNGDAVLPGYKTGLLALDGQGRLISDIQIPYVAARYPWRLAPYLDYQFESLYVNHQQFTLEEMKYESYDLYVYLVSLYPSLGLNATWVGGHQGQLGFNQVALNTYGRFYVAHTTDARRPDRLVVFASARGPEPGVQHAVYEGYFEVRSPYLTASGGNRWADEFHPNLRPGDYGFISPRYDHEAVAAFMDLHVEALTADELQDMQYWSKDATHKNWALVPR